MIAASSRQTEEQQQNGREKIWMRNKNIENIVFQNSNAEMEKNW